MSALVNAGANGGMRPRPLRTRATWSASVIFSAMSTSDGPRFPSPWVPWHAEHLVRNTNAPWDSPGRRVSAELAVAVVDDASVAGPALPLEHPMAAAATMTAVTMRGGPTRPADLLGMPGS